MELNRRDVLRGAAIATAGSLTILTGAGTASADLSRGHEWMQAYGLAPGPPEVTLSRSERRPRRCSSWTPVSSNISTTPAPGPASDITVVERGTSQSLPRAASGCTDA